MNLEQIDTSTTAGKAEVMRLAAEGRGVAEARIVHSHEGRAKLVDKWSLCHSPSWNWRENVYAIISEPVLDRPARVGGRDFPAGSLIQQVIGRAHAEYDRHHHKRDPRDVASDPEGFLVYANGEPMMAAKRREPVGPDEVWVDFRTVQKPYYLYNEVDARSWASKFDVQLVRYIRADLAGERG